MKHRQLVIQLLHSNARTKDLIEWTPLDLNVLTTHFPFESSKKQKLKFMSCKGSFKNIFFDCLKART